MATLAALRKQAKDLGVPKPMILRATDPAELQQIVDDFTDHLNGDESPKKAAPRKKSQVTKPAPAPRKKSGSTRAPAKKKSAQTGEAKRRGTATATKKRSNGYVPKGGRNVLENVKFTVTDGWNPRKGSAPERIIAALKKSKGKSQQVDRKVREAAFDLLVGDIWDFVGKKKRDGSKRTMQEAREMLTYRISRTLFDFAIKTGQHESAENRVEYGTGGTGEGIWKAKKAPAPARKPRATKTAPKPAPRKRTAQKPVQRRTEARKPAPRKPQARKTAPTPRKAVKKAPATRKPRAARR